MVTLTLRTSKKVICHEVPLGSNLKYGHMTCLLVCLIFLRTKPPIFISLWFKNTVGTYGPHLPQPISAGMDLSDLITSVGKGNLSKLTENQNELVYIAHIKHNFKSALTVASWSLFHPRTILYRTISRLCFAAVELFGVLPAQGHEMNLFCE